MGRLVIQELRNTGKRIRAFDLPSADFSPFDSDPEIEVAAGDINSASDAAAAVDGVESLIHLAAILPPLSEANPKLTNHVNVEGTRVLLDGVSRLSPGARVVFSSSVSVYGRPSQPGRIVTADDPMTPDDHYARSKAESEKLVRESGLDWVALRISGVSVPVFQEPPSEWPFPTRSADRVCTQGRRGFGIDCGSRPFRADRPVPHSQRRPVLANDRRPLRRGLFQAGRGRPTGRGISIRSRPLCVV